MTYTLHHGDCLDILPTLEAQSVHCCVTSPPYYGLRDYGHEGQIGLEDTPDAYVARLVAVFREVRRVLRDDGTLWLNLGDSYAGSSDGSYRPGDVPGAGGDLHGSCNRNGTPRTSIAAKNILGIPWRVAFALQTDGWYLRQDIIWHKPNPMPESVTDRCTKAHEYVFLLSKSQKYYYDHTAIMQDAICIDDKRNGKGNIIYDGKRSNQKGGGQHSFVTVNDKANKRSVWTVTTKPFADAHFATFPEDLIVDMIKAGCPEGGIVLDPFMGAGTTALVARKLNRQYVGFELNPEYIKIAEKRIYNQIGLFL